MIDGTVDGRQMFPRLAGMLGAASVACIVGAGLIAGLDGRPVELDDRSIWGLAEPWLPEALLIAGSLLAPAALMCLFGVRSGGFFARLPGGRFIGAYAIWLGITGIPLMVVLCGFAMMFTSLRDFPRRSDGLEEVAVWLAHRSPFIMLGAGVAGGLLLVLALVALAIVTALRGTREERTVAANGVAMAGLVLLVFAFAILLVLPIDRGAALAAGALIVLVAALLFVKGRRQPDLPEGMVNRRLNARGIIIGFIALTLTILYFVLSTR